MTLSQATRVIEIERDCVNNAIHNQCNRDCANCNLVIDGEEIINAYDIAIKVLIERDARTSHLYNVTKGEWVF